MKKICFILALLAGFTAVQSQSLKRYNISNTGASIASYCDPGKFGITYSADSAKVYTSECGLNDTYYMVICIEMKKNLPVIKAETALLDYLDLLKAQFKIVSATGYVKGQRLNAHEETRGIVDYWKDNEQFNWKVKGWTDGKLLAVLVAYSKKNLPETTINPFLDGLLFKGM